MRTDLLSRPWLLYAADDDAGSGAGDAGGTDDQSQEDGDGSPGGGDTGSHTDAEKAALKAEAQKLRQRLRATEQERDKLAEGQKTEQEKLADRAAKAEERAQLLESRLQEKALRSAIADKRTEVGIVASTATVARLLDRDQIEWDDDGEPTDKSLTAALRALAKSDPILVRAGSSDGGEGGRRQKNTSDMNALIRGAVGRAA